MFKETKEKNPDQYTAFKIELENKKKEREITKLEQDIEGLKLTESL